MAERINGQGALFNNKRKQRDNQPDYTGNIKIGKDLMKAFLDAFKKNPSVEFIEAELAAWNKKGQRAGDFISVSMQPPFEKRAASNKPISDDPF